MARAQASTRASNERVRGEHMEVFQQIACQHPSLSIVQDLPKMKTIFCDLQRCTTFRAQDFVFGVCVWILCFVCGECVCCVSVDFVLCVWIFCVWCVFDCF